MSDEEQFDYDGYNDQYSEQQPQPQIIQGIDYLEIEDVTQVIRKIVQEQQETLNFSEDNTFELLMYYGWNKEEIEHKYYNNQNTILTELKSRGILNNHQKIIWEKVYGCCPVCWLDKNLITLGCGHSFCEQCIQETIQQRVLADKYLVVRCLQNGCLYRLPFSMIKKLVQSQEFERLICKNFANSTRALAYCTGADCNKILKPKVTTKEVTCMCGNRFCFSCKEDLHPPCPCDIVKKWLIETKKDEANVRWIAVNTKICPFCKKPVERSEGCNYMMCKPPGGCGKAFCYVCSKPWEPDHKDHFNCAQYVQKGDDLEKEKEIIKRYNFYYERFLNAEASGEKTKQRLKRLENYIKPIQEFYEFSYQEAIFLKEVLEELIDSRGVLKWSYCIGYYISKNDYQSAKLFEDYQQQFEHACDILAKQLIDLFNIIEIIEMKQQKANHDQRKDFVLRKERIQNASQMCYKIRTSLENDVYSGKIKT